MKRNHAALFSLYDQANPQVYQAFKRISESLKADGARHWGAKAICEQIRWESAVRALKEHGLPVYKVNNNYPKYLAKKLVFEAPRFEGFFDFREGTND